MKLFAIQTYYRNAADVGKSLLKVWIVSDGERTLRGRPRDTLGELRMRWVEVFGSDFGEIEIVARSRTPENAYMTLLEIATATAAGVVANLPVDGAAKIPPAIPRGEGRSRAGQLERARAAKAEKSAALPTANDARHRKLCPKCGREVGRVFALKAGSIVFDKLCAICEPVVGQPFAERTGGVDGAIPDNRGGEPPGREGPGVDREDIQPRGGGRVSGEGADVPEDEAGAVRPTVDGRRVGP